MERRNGAAQWSGAMERRRAMEWRHAMAPRNATEMRSATERRNGTAPCNGKAPRIGRRNEVHCFPRGQPPHALHLCASPPKFTLRHLASAVPLLRDVRREVHRRRPQVRSSEHMCGWGCPQHWAARAARGRDLPPLGPRALGVAAAESGRLSAEATREVPNRRKRRGTEPRC